MELSEFICKELEFKNAFLNSEDYLKLQELSVKINADEKIIDLAKKRDEEYLLAKDEMDERKKKNHLLQAKQYIDKIEFIPHVKEYYRIYNRLKDILDVLNESIFTILKDD